MRNRRLRAIIAIACLGAVVAGCSHTVEREKEWGKDGTKIRDTHKVDSKVKSDLKRILATETVEGEGVFKNANQSVAVNAAMNLAINDLAKRAGQLIQEEDTTLYNEKVYSIIRTRARNIVSGFDVVVKEWDGDSQTATVRIRQDGYRIAEELCKYVTD